MDQSSQIVLIGDVGGTNVRLQIFRTNTTNYDSNPPLKSKTYHSSDFPTFLEFVQDFVSDTKEYPHFAVLGIAGAIKQNTTKLANTSWPTVDGTEIGKKLKIEPFILLNDFHVLSYGVLGLKDEFLIPLIKGRPDDFNSVKVVTGPGTGLGVALMFPIGNKQFRVWPTEGGHQNLSSSNKLELSFQVYMADKLNSEQVQLEWAMAGPGIPYVYNFIKENHPNDEPLLEKENPDKKFDLTHPKSFPSKLVFQRALVGDDLVCKKTLEFYCEIYETALGDIITSTMPFGGIYLFGGLTLAITDFIKQRIVDGKFLGAYRADRQYFSHVFEDVPIYVIKKQELGLEGAYQTALKLQSCNYNVSLL